MKFSYNVITTIYNMDEITTNITTEPSPSDRYQHHHHQHQHHINKYNTQHKCSTQQDFGHAYMNVYIFNDRSLYRNISSSRSVASLLYLFVAHIIIWVAISFLMGSVCILLNRHFGMYCVCEWVCWKSTDWKWNLLLLIKMHFINKCAYKKKKKRWIEDCEETLCLLSAF